MTYNRFHYKTNLSTHYINEEILTLPSKKFFMVDGLWTFRLTFEHFLFLQQLGHLIHDEFIIFSFSFSFLFGILKNNYFRGYSKGTIYSE